VFWLLFSKALDFVRFREPLKMCFFYKKHFQHIIVISTKEKSSPETRQRLDFDCGATCEDFSFVEMTNFAIIFKLGHKKTSG